MHHNCHMAFTLWLNVNGTGASLTAHHSHKITLQWRNLELGTLSPDVQRDQENRAALFSFWNGAILGYNLHKGEGMAPPPLSQWARVLVSFC